MPSSLLWISAQRPNRRGAKSPPHNLEFNERRFAARRCFALTSNDTTISDRLFGGAVSETRRRVKRLSVISINRTSADRFIA
ncbi:MAG: hypothetical protein M3371_09990, partial [Acidobacteriota bacterium]|nr:hypothetical protein [Acidobacteriota bacterium]